MATPDPVTLDELPGVTAASGDDTLLISVDGAARKITLDALLASVAQDAKLVSGSSAERVAYAPAELTLWYETDSGGWWAWRPGSASWARLTTTEDIQAPAYIAGLQVSRQSATEILIQAGSLEINGTTYNLPQNIVLPVTVWAGSLGWRCIYVSPPSGTLILTESNFHDMAFSAATFTRKGGGIYTASGGARVIALYPTASNAVLPGFAISGDSYTFQATVMVDTTSPPTTSTTIPLGLPNIGQPVTGQFLVHAAATNAVLLAVVFGGYQAINFRTGAPAGLVANTAVSSLPSSNGNTTVYVNAGTGTPSLLAVTLMSVRIPSGLAR